MISASTCLTPAIIAAPEAGRASTKVLLDHYRRGIEQETADHWDRCATVERKMKGGKIADAAEAKRQRFDPMVGDFFVSLMRRVLLSDNPVAALKRLIGPKKPRGRPVRNAGRDFGLAVKVAARHRAGLTVTEAVDAVRQSMPGRALSAERVAIYQRHRLEALATAAEAAMKRVTNSGGELATFTG